MYGTRVDAETAATLRELTQEPNLTEVTVYDADFPTQVGQQFVSATLTTPDGGREVDLTNPENAKLNEELYEISCEIDQSVKFFLVLPEVR